MTRQLRPSEHCLNCGKPVATRFCADCGQENTNYRVSLGRLLGDLFDEVFQIESRIWRSLWTLVRHPGRLTVEYNAGRRVRYTTPLRLYVLTSFVYFFTAAVLPMKVDNVQVKIEAKQNGLDIEKLPPPKTAFERRVREKLGVVEKIDPQQAKQRVHEIMVVNVPRAMAVLVPLFALLLMLFFRGRYYVEHLVLALHVHSFAFAISTLAVLTRVDLVENLAFVGAAAWMLIALRVVYRQSWLRTSLKALALAIVYGVLLLVGIIGAFLLGLLFG